MKIATDLLMSEQSHRGYSYTQVSGAHLLEAIGEDLRTVYSDLTRASQPADLVRLAALIDEQRSSRSEED